MSRASTRTHRGARPGARFAVALAAAALAGLPAPAGAQTETLRHDPFARPSLTAPQPRVAPPAPEAALSAPQEAQAAAPPEAPWNPELIAVMVAGPQSIANLDGIMVRIGNTINGHVLVEVHEEEAVLQKGDERRVIPIRGRGDAPRNAQEKR